MAQEHSSQKASSHRAKPHAMKQHGKGQLLPKLAYKQRSNCVYILNMSAQVGRNLGRPHSSPLPNTASSTCVALFPDYVPATVRYEAHGVRWPDAWQFVDSRRLMILNVNFQLASSQSAQASLVEPGRRLHLACYLCAAAEWVG